MAAVTRAVPPTTMALGSTPRQLLAQVARVPVVSTHRKELPEYLQEIKLVLILHVSIEVLTLLDSEVCSGPS